VLQASCALKHILVQKTDVTVVVAWRWHHMKINGHR